MTRRALLTATAVIVATSLALAFTSMTWNPLAVLGLWIASIAVAVVLAGAVSAALERRDHRAMYSAVWKDARRALR